MIWVLLEITLPLCLAFLFGLGAGWLFWRWRRRSISQSEWDSHGKMSATDALKFSTLQEEAGVYQRRAEQLEVSAQQHFTELQEAEKRTQALTAELNSAKNKLAALPSDEKGNNQNFSVVQNLDKALAPEMAAREEQQANKIQELEFKSNNLQNRVDEKEKLLQQSNRDIKKLNEELKSANEKLLSKESVVSSKDLAAVESQLSDAASEKAQLEQKLQQVTTDANVHKNASDDLKAQIAALEGTIERQADELLVEKKQALEVTEELDKLRVKLKETNESSVDEAHQLKDKLDLVLREKEEQQTINSELQQAMEQLEKTIGQQSSELQDADEKLKKLADDLNKENQQLKQQLQDVSSRADKQTEIATELQQKLKQSETVTTERDDAIQGIKQLESELSDAKQNAKELQQTKTQLQNVSQRFKNFQASAVANRQAREEQIETFKTRIERLRNSLEQQRQKASDSAADKEKILLLESQLAETGEAENELNSARATILDLNKQLSDRTAELTKKEENNKSEAHQLARENVELHRQLEEAEKNSRELKNVESKLAETTTQLNNARARNKQLAANAQIATTSTAVTPISVAQINRLKKTVDEKEKIIEALENKLKLKNNKKKATVKAAKNSWQKGETKVGTPGSDHKDDLTAISGIGPKIEKVLNKLGIISWEQLATLKSADVKRVDEKLADFSGRITRDEWVPQAKAIIQNGHQPVEKTATNTTKKAKQSNKSKSDWQNGKTRFGTPGSLHKDDLQVINGIGPVIEKTLNRYGVKSWEQLASLKAEDVKTIDETLDFPGRIKREKWVAQAKSLVKQFPDQKDRPTRRTFLNPVAASK